MDQYMTPDRGGPRSISLILDAVATRSRTGFENFAVQVQRACGGKTLCCANASSDLKVQADIFWALGVKATLGRQMPIGMKVTQSGAYPFYVNPKTGSASRYAVQHQT